MEVLENKNNLLISKIDNIIYFTSYKTTICKYNTITKKININAMFWDYSQTTLKQLKHFINNYTDFNYENKKQFEREIQNNINIEEYITI